MLSQYSAQKADEDVKEMKPKEKMVLLNKQNESMLSKIRAHQNNIDYFNNKIHANQEEIRKLIAQCKDEDPSYGLGIGSYVGQ